MAYTIQQLSQLAGVSTRTLRYYDEMNLLKPAFTTKAGYRMYEENEVNLLQEILFFRTLDFSLEKISKLIHDPKHERMKALEAQKALFIERKAQLDELIQNIEWTLSNMRGETQMTDAQKFAALKEEMIRSNEEQYGEEIRDRYGDEIVDAANEKFKKMDKLSFDDMKKLEEAILVKLNEAFETKDPSSLPAQELAEMHKTWICSYWDTYTKKAHAGLAQTYMDDERFIKYYDPDGKGLVKFLRDAIWVYAGMTESIFLLDEK